MPIIMSIPAASFACSVAVSSGVGRYSTSVTSATGDALAFC